MVSLKIVKTLKIFSLVVSLLSLVHKCESVDSEKEVEIGKLVENIFMENNKIQGVGLAVVEDSGNTILARGYGYRDLENKLLATNETKFAIASITKTFTATIVVKVLSEKFPEFGASVMEMPILELHPNGNFTFSDRFRSEYSSFRDLLSHRHGLQTESLGLGAGAYVDSNEYTYRTRYAKQVGSFRATGYYSNSIYALVGKLIAEIAGQRYEDLVENLFSEIGMNDSTYFKDSENYENLPNMSRGYYLKNGEITKSNPELWKRITTALPAGGIITTSLDMAKYIAFHLNLGKVGNQQVITEAAMEWLRQPSFAIDMTFKKLESDIIDGGYALGTGFSLGVYDGWAYLSHNGMWTPFTSEMRIYPALKFGTFSVINGPSDIYESPFNHAFLHREIHKIVYSTTNQTHLHSNSDSRNIFKPVPQPPIYNLTRFLNKKNPSHQQIDPSTLVGIFGNPIEGIMEISLAPENHPNATLYMKFGKYATAYLIPLEMETSTTFKVVWDSDFIEEFYFNIGTIDDQSILDYVNQNPNNLQLIFGGESFLFIRNATLDSLPKIPWKVGSCGPEFIL